LSTSHIGADITIETGEVIVLANILRRLPRL